jgi:hypothetical protein
MCRVRYYKNKNKRDKKENKSKNSFQYWYHGRKSLEKKEKKEPLSHDQCMGRRLARTHAQMRLNPRVRRGQGHMISCAAYNKSTPLSHVEPMRQLHCP